MKPILVLSTKFPFWSAGFTLYPFIFIRTSSRMWNRNITIRRQLVRHECIHIWQFRRMGWVEFAVKYITQLWQVGYHDNPYEVEAYAHDETNEVQTLPRDLEEFVQTIQ